MEAYTDFASVYDMFMDETPYEEWADFIVSLIETYGVSRPVSGGKAGKEKGRSESGRAKPADQEEILCSERDLVLDLGCGTGTLTELLAQRGYDMIGVDLSREMLGAALAKKEKAGSGTLYLCQDMRELDLYSTVGTVVCVCDSINYLLEEGEVEAVFRAVENFLNPGGLFIMDFNTVYKYEQVIGDTTIAENREEGSFIWENYYHKEEKINEYDLTVYVREKDQELFRRFEETHFQRGYTLEEMKERAERAGLQVLLTLDADTHEPADPCSERIYVVAKECRKAGGE